MSFWEFRRLNYFIIIYKLFIININNLIQIIYIYIIIYNYYKFFYNYLYVNFKEYILDKFKLKRDWDSISHNGSPYPDLIQGEMM